MADEAGVANLALGRLGQGLAISALSDNTPAAQFCNRFFNQCRQEVLRAFPWGFATRAEALAAVAGQTFPGWEYVYQYPNGCLNIRAVGDEGGIRYVRNLAVASDPSYFQSLRTMRYPWQLAVKDDGASQVVLSDVPDAWAYHTLDVENLGAWPADAVSVLAWRLAAEVGGPLQAKSSMVDRAEQRYSVWFAQAAAATMNEQKDDMVSESPSIACRY